ncbi:Na(+)/H(+) antiporter subunit C [Salibacterium salarium]|uniref:Na(+)/H(+) antiporter subunit C n=1 Tax=Salibacterium salarium TaxID=284579 RepID=A0A428N7T8_9BACI|nr:Na(+)/H(+) antiporter subunit C [Salibacterium salarium]RSL34446.1 Na(+)/H(+) antiporter subunit C [Salibacterium salarium]
MEIIMSILAGILFMGGTYLVLSKNMIRIIIGTSIISHGAHVLLLTMAGLKTGAPPLLGLDASTYTDPLPQALILTAIVISFGVTSFFLVLGYRTYKVTGTDNTERMRGTDSYD